MQEIGECLKKTNEKLHSARTILSTMDNHSIQLSSSTRCKLSNNKMRETLYRIARPIDQQFSLTVCFNHQHIVSNTVDDMNDDDSDDDVKQRCHDLNRITNNVINFLTLESEMLDQKNQSLLTDIRNIAPGLIAMDLSLEKRIEIYNYCLYIIEYFQPYIEHCIQRTNLYYIPQRHTFFSTISF